jgi:aminoglycoside/choline kinase family phosphotransferase
MTIPAAPEKNFPKARFCPSYLSAIMEKIFKWPAFGIHCEGLEGDASDRSYFRVAQKKSGEVNRNKAQKSLQSLIVMQLEKPVLDMEIDFIRVLKFFRGLDLPAPELFYYDASKGLLFLEDCGTMTLKDQLHAFPQDKARLYRQAVELLVRMQSQATHSVDSTCPAYHRKFDVKKLMWELNFMLDYYVGEFCGSPLESSARKELREVFTPLCESLAAEKLYFTHRDYHSRNLMCDQGHLILIDFQDARMGPCQYDLVSLLKDSYVNIEDTLVEELIDYYILLKEKEEGQKMDRERFRDIFDKMSIQRNLKAVGTFAYQSVKNNNNRYEGFITPTLGYVRKALRCRFKGSSLQKVLSKHIPGLDQIEAINL